MKQIISLLTLLFLCVTIYANEVIKETHTYSIKGIDTLKLDRYYTISNYQPQDTKPAIIFIFGGAFYTGTRDFTFFLPCFEYYANQGYEVFSIDYRLGFKHKRFKSIKPVSRFGKLVDSTINLAVEDLYDATTFIIGKSKQWNINTNIIVPFGSSSGAITALHAEYYIVNGHILANKLPVGFRYGGIIAMAGSIFNTKGKITWSKKAAPILMFHGNADRNVPYNKNKIFKYGLYGSKSIAKSLKKIDSPYYFCTFEGAMHEMAGLPMNNNREDINYFLQKLVIEKQPLEIIKFVTDFSNKKKIHKYTTRDYLEANFKPKNK